MAKDPERWLLTHQGVRHVVEIVESGLSRRITWTLDGDEVAAKKSSEEKVTLDGGDHGAIGLRLPTFTGPARRVTWWGPEATLGAVAAAQTGLGGLDLDPEAGSKAAAREAWIREHPQQYAVRRTAAAVAGVVVPLLLIWLLGRFALPAIPWPDLKLPDIPWPNLPSIPWPSIPLPDLPSIPWPDWSLPGWVETVLDSIKYVWPVLLAVALARAEIKRRRDQDARKRAASEASEESEREETREP
ncbi:hypothetical protein [Nocardioides houyundeii]|uniref:hypothetical protein n=1 Tax=Nocardioides houyundeii TaxID=2045452 RepID=UPI000DF2290E|nr:hypothetical protein [Nocardioides houyundeii]